MQQCSLSQGCASCWRITETKRKVRFSLVNNWTDRQQQQQRQYTFVVRPWYKILVWLGDGPHRKVSWAFVLKKCEHGARNLTLCKTTTSAADYRSLNRINHQPIEYETTYTTKLLSFSNCCCFQKYTLTNFVIFSTRSQALSFVCILSDFGEHTFERHLFSCGE